MLSRTVCSSIHHRAIGPRGRIVFPQGPEAEIKFHTSEVPFSGVILGVPFDLQTKYRPPPFLNPFVSFVAARTP